MSLTAFFGNPPVLICQAYPGFLREMLLSLPDGLTAFSPQLYYLPGYQADLSSHSSSCVHLLHNIWQWYLEIFYFDFSFAAQVHLGLLVTTLLLALPLVPSRRTEPDCTSCSFHQPSRVMCLSQRSWLQRFASTHFINICHLNSSTDTWVWLS